MKLSVVLVLGVVGAFATLPGCEGLRSDVPDSYQGVARFSCTQGDGSALTLLRRVRASSAHESRICGDAAAASASLKDYFDDVGAFSSCAGGVSSVVEQTDWVCAPSADFGQQRDDAALAAARVAEQAEACMAGAGACDFDTETVVDISDYLASR